MLSCYPEAMKIQSHTPPQTPKTLKAREPKEGLPQESFSSGDRAFQAMSATSRTFTRLNVAVASGVTLGIGIGSLLQATLSVTPLSFVAGGACGLVAAYGGYHAGGSMSDWAGKLGARADQSQPERGEAIARGLMNAATGLVLCQSPGVAALQFGITALNGGITQASEK